MSKFIDINTFEVKDNYFEVDDNIAEAISLLNKKGYKTRNCCEGHLFLEEFAVGSDETVDDEWETNCEVEEGYIEFDSSITITSVPNGWTLCDRSDIGDTQTIYFEYPVIKSLKDIKVKDSKDVKEQFAQERTRGMDSLLKWANELPDICNTKLKSKGLIDEIIERSEKVYISDVDDYWCGIHLKTLESLRYLDENHAKVEYGMISETDEIEVWYEPINDEIDGFVIRNKDEEHSIVKTYIPFDDDREIKIVHESTDVTTDTKTTQKFGTWQLG